MVSAIFVTYYADSKKMQAILHNKQNTFLESQSMGIPQETFPCIGDSLTHHFQETNNAMYMHFL